MKRFALFLGLAAILVTHGTWVVLTQAPAGPAFRAEKVKGDLYMISGEGGNVAAYVTPDGVVLVDDMYDRNHDAVLAQVRQLSDRPLKYVFNTHQHDDHAGGDARMLPIAEVIAHRNARANLVAKKQPFFEETPGTPIGLPRMTFSDEASVFLGGKEVRAQYFGRGHTSGDAIIYFPELGVVHTGDLYLSTRGGAARAGAPPATERPASVPIYVDYSQGGSFLAWTSTLDGLLTLDFDTIIPGHGPVAKRADLIKFRADLETMRTRIKGLVRDKTRDELIRLLETDYGWRATGCAPSPPRSGCLQFQQVDALIAELK